ncbi:MAG: hypothetical protein Q8O92_04425 [Candidatus Latescibacter sp.]|nr:hypothetical protein [Candidatus Latescibacter sp.]
MRFFLFLYLTISLTAMADAQTSSGAPKAGKTPYSAWERGLPPDPGFFPLAVWLQDPSNAEKYKAAGINLYVGLWQGPTEEQLAALRKAGMRVICSQNTTGMKYKDDPVIAGWMHGDEPDNAQSQGEGKGYGPPILPEKIIADYEKIRAADPSRPVLLNLGQAVAWDNYIGRGVRRNHPEDYPEYARGGDIVSFDIYPVTSPYPEIKGNLWYVPAGVERLRAWAGSKKIVWNCIECTYISSGNKATPHQVRAEVWMSIIHGSGGIIYFVHEWKPKFNEHALLDDPEMLEAVTRLNAQIREMAPVLNSPTVTGKIEVKSASPEIPVDTLMKQYRGETYIFAAGMRNGETKASFTLSGGNRTAEVVGEGRTIAVRRGTFEDDFKPYDVHIYRIK